MIEREMNRHQRGMVDGCFEEGHYQRGIATLNQLRMENLRPSPAHIRQLIYIALYPPPPPKGSAKGKGKRKEMASVSASPSKQIQQARRLQKQALFPPPEATRAAKELLHQFSMDSISPEALLRSVPCYPLSQAELDNAPRPVKDDMFFGNTEGPEDMDSYVAKQSARLKDCKDCWTMLRKGVVTRQDLALVQKADPFLEADVQDENEEDDASSAVLGKHSWHLLEWFIQLFEKDQALVENSEDTVEERYSVLLLSQIKPSSRSGDPRSYTDSVLEIVFLCYSQTEQWRRNLGKRLMTLLVALTMSRNFSPLQLLATISVRLQASSSNMLAAFFNNLPSTSRGLTIKLAVCDRFLTQSLRGSASADVDGVARARPQARKARPVSAHASSDLVTSSNTQGVPRNQISHPQWNLPSSHRILQLLGQNSNIRSSSSAPLPNLNVLFHLVAAFGTLRTEEGEDADRSWADAVLTGELERRISDIYSDDGLSESDRKSVRPLRLLLLSMYIGWKRLYT